MVVCWEARRVAIYQVPNSSGTVEGTNCFHFLLEEMEASGRNVWSKSVMSDGVDKGSQINKNPN